MSEKPFAYTEACFNTHSLGFEGLNSLDGAADVVGHGLEVLQQLLRLVNNGLVLQHRAVMSEVDGCRLRGVLVGEPLGIGVSLSEGLNSGNGL